MVFGLQFLVLWFTVYHSWFMVSSLWLMVDILQLIAYSLQFTIQNLRLQFIFQNLEFTYTSGNQNHDIPKQAFSILSIFTSGLSDVKISLRSNGTENIQLQTEIIGEYPAMLRERLRNITVLIELYRDLMSNIYHQLQNNIKQRKWNTDFIINLY